MNTAHTNDLACSLQRGLHAPLRALQIALEDLRAGRSSAAVLPGAIEVVRRVQRELDALQACVEPLEPAPMACTTRQVALCVRDLLGEDGGRLILAFEGPATTLFVDPDLLAKSLVRLLEGDGPHAAVPSMLHVRTEGDTCCFTLLTHATSTGREPSRLCAEGAEHLGLMLALAARDLTRLGAAASFRIESNGIALTDVRLRVTGTEKEAA